MSALEHANRVLESCGSTNDLARELGEAGAPHGTWVSTRRQDQGRGRLGRQWQSLEGNLFLSVIVRVEDKAQWTWVPLATAVSVARWMDRALPMSAERLRIKWPNDLWVGGAKLGGILCEAVGNRSGSFVVIGLGLNCTHAPEGLDQRTVSLSEVDGSVVTADDVRAGVFASIVETMDELSDQGAGGIVRDYERRAAFGPGAQIAWGSDQSGVVRGLGPNGELIVVSGGEELKLFAEDVRGLRGA